MRAIPLPFSRGLLGITAHGEQRKLALLVAAVAAYLVPTTAQTQTSPEAEPPSVQLAQPQVSGGLAAPVTVTLQDALARAQKNDAQFLAAVTDSKVANEDRIQARDALLPSVSDSTQFLGTEGNGKTPEGRFVTNDGVHVYRQWAVLRQDLSPQTYMLTGYHRAAAAEAIAKAKLEIARRGLALTVTRNYYAVIVAERKYAATQQSLTQAKQFWDIAQDLEHAGQSPHSDAIRAQIQYQQQKQALEDTNLAMENARLDLAVLLFPVLNENFTVVDDMDSPVALPPFGDAEAMAAKQNPDLRVAQESVRESDLDVSAAKGAFLPSLSLETDYGIEANDFALRSVAKAHPELGPLPTLGYFVTASLTFPVWDWGSSRSRVHQAEYKEQQARAEMTEAERQVLSNLYSCYNEASVARESVDSARRAAELAAESLRLANLRYQGGETTVLEVVDAQNTLTLSQNSLAEAQARYRIGLANLQTLTGSF